MEVNYSQLLFPVTKLVECFRSEVLQKIKELEQKIKLLEDRLVPEVVLSQTAESKEAVKVQCKGKSTKLTAQDLKNKQPTNIYDIFDKPTDIPGLQGARRMNAVTGSGRSIAILRSSHARHVPRAPCNRGPRGGTRKTTSQPNATKKQVSAKVTRKRNLFLLIALAFYTLPPGIEGYSDPVRYNISTRINQSVILSADAKEDDDVEWLLIPTENSSGYETLHDGTREIPRKDGCGGYQFAKNHSIIIPSAQLCHAGTYTAIIINRDLPSTVINLTVDDIPEVSTETTASSGTMFHLAWTTASNTESTNVNTVLAVVITVSCVFVFAIVVVVVGLYLTGKCKRIWNKAPTGGNMEDGELQTSQERRFLATTEQTTSFSPRS